MYLLKDKFSNLSWYLAYKDQSMKLPFCIFLVLMNLSAFSQDDGCFDLKQLIENEKMQYESKANFKTTAHNQSYEISFHRLDLIVDPSINFIKGIVTTFFTPISKDFDQITFDLIDTMTVSQVHYSGETLLFSQSNDELLIYFNDTLQQGILDSLNIHYSGNPSSTGYGSFAVSEHHSVPVMWTLSEPYGAKTWWPCKEDLHDKVDSLEMIIRGPDQYKAASNGTLISEDTAAGTRTTVWSHHYPIAHYLIAFAITDYVDFSDYAILSTGDSLQILNYVYPENLSKAQTELKQTIELMEFFDDIFGPYPFAKEKYGHADFGWGGGMEHQTMSFMGSYSFDLVAHELAHQWFGNKITCNSWSELWINESFATYANGLAYERLDIINWFPFKELMMKQAKINNDLSVYIEDTTDVQRMFNENTYYKGAALLHMLRWKLGDADFFTALKNYSTDPVLSYETATTLQFKNHLETVSGLNLDEFFSDWYTGKGYPTYQISWDYDNGKFYLKVDQTTTNSAVSFFEIPIPVHVYGEGQDSLLKFDHTNSGQLFEIELPFVVDSITFNAELQLLIDTVIISNDELLGSYTTNQTLFSIYPNPTKHRIVINHVCENCSKKISCTNAIGELIYEFHSTSSREIVDISTWALGTYFIKVQSDGQVQSALIFKH